MGASSIDFQFNDRLRYYITTHVHRKYNNCSLTMFCLQWACTPTLPFLLVSNRRTVANGHYYYYYCYYYYMKFIISILCLSVYILSRGMGSFLAARKRKYNRSLLVFDAQFHLLSFSFIRIISNWISGKKIKIKSI